MKVRLNLLLYVTDININAGDVHKNFMEDMKSKFEYTFRLVRIR